MQRRHQSGGPARTRGERIKASGRGRVGLPEHLQGLRLRAAKATLCTTELPESESVPPIIVTGSFIYLRLRRDIYDGDQIRAWANRIAPFLDGGLNAFVFFRHDETGRTPRFALDLRDQVLATHGRSIRA